MKVGILEFRDVNGRCIEVIEAYEKILAHNGIPFERLKAGQTDFLERAAKLDLLLVRWGHYDHDRQIALAVLPVVENLMGVKCYPDLSTCWHYDDKIRQWLMMQARGYPMVASRVFWERGEALAWLEREAEFPQVFKLAAGAGSSNVLLVEDAARGKRLVRRMFGSGILPGRVIGGGDVRLRHFSPWRETRRALGNLRRRLRGLDSSPWWQAHKNYALFQRYLPGNDSDTRVTLIGNRAFAFRRLTRAGDFRASGSGRIDYDQDKIDPRCIEIAHRISEEMKFQSMAYDFLFTPEGEPQFCEISYTYLSRTVYDCPGYWDRELNYRSGHFWPEWCHLSDCLGLPDLKVPELDY